MSLQNKIDFALIIQVKNANPNGDPLNGNRPRVDFEGLGEITDVCLKRKLRDRLLELGHSIFMQSDDRKNDEYSSLRARAEGILGKEAFMSSKKKKKQNTTQDTGTTKPITKEETIRKACKQWLDVRSFGQVFAFGKKDKNKEDSQDDKSDESKSAEGISIAIRGPVTLQSAFSVEPVSITSTQITKSVSGEGDGSKKGSDTMGMKHRVDSGVYVVFGAITPQLAERTGFSDQDAETIKAILPKLFEGDASSARPEGSMAIKKVFWWKHKTKAGQYSSAKVHATLKVRPDGNYELQSLPGLDTEVIEGF